MTRTLDRVLFVTYVRSYLIVLTSLLSLYVVVDLFTNIDDFSNRGGGMWKVLEHIGTYYAYRVSQIFDRLSEGISLLAAMFTVAWMMRSNELLPQLSAGVPTRRVIRPIVLAACLTLAIGPVNQELVIPKIADELMKPKDDPDGARAIVVPGGYDGTGVHIEAVAGFRNEKRVTRFYATFPETASSAMAHLAAEEAQYLPPGSGQYGGGWLLLRTTPDVFDGPLPPGLEMINPGRFFLRVEDADFDAVTRGPNWFAFASTAKLRELLDRPDPRRLGPIAVMFHMRLVRPLAGILLVMLGLAVILRDTNRNVYINVGLCLGMAAVFYVAQLGCKFLGDNDYVTPPLAAWLPILIFGPVTLAYLDAIHT